jgi:GNAT superfamily N-acetyltransferase
MIDFDISRCSIADIEFLFNDARAEGVLISSDLLTFACRSNAIIIGFCGLKILNETAWLKMDYVIPEARRQGILSAMIQARLDEIYGVCKKAVYANVTQAALGAHLKMGAFIVRTYKNGITRVQYRV